MKIKHIVCDICHKSNGIEFMIATSEGAIYVDIHGNIICNSGGNIDTLDELIEYTKNYKNSNRFSERPQFLFSCSCVEDECGATEVEFEDGTILKETNNFDLGERSFKKAFMGE